MNLNKLVCKPDLSKPCGTGPICFVDGFVLFSLGTTFLSEKKETINNPQFSSSKATITQNTEPKFEPKHGTKIINKFFL